MEQLRLLAAAGFMEESKERNKKFGDMAPIITIAAEAGSPLAQNVCDEAMKQIMVGVEILGSFFQSDHVSVTGIGSVVNSPYMKLKFNESLRFGKNKQYVYKAPELSAASGAVIKALQHVSVPVDARMIEFMRRHPHTAW